MSYCLDFSNKTVLVTGATMGIGAAIAEHFKESGAELILTGIESEDVIDRLNRELKIKGIDNIHYYHVDFTEEESYNRLFEIMNNYNKIDVCINNAGTNRNNPIEETRLEDYQLLIDVNLTAPFRICRYVSKIMKKNNYGRIINIASIWSVKTRSTRSIYSITKTGLLGLTRTVAVELAPYNILVNAVSPGFTLTELTKATLSQDEFNKLTDLVPAKRFAQPDEIAKTVLFLASDLNTYITGQNLVVDGGFTNV